MKESKYFNLIIELANFMLENLNNQLLFSEKIKLLEINIKETEGKTEGKLISESDNNLTLFLSINPNNNEMFIKLVIFHELFHLLFRDINKLKISGYCSTDDSFSFTNIIRVCNDTKKTKYGFSLEELLCDFLGIEMLHRLYNKKYTYYDLLNIVYEKDNHTYFCKENYYLTKNIVKQFGNLPSNKLDEYSDGRPDNLLLYTVINNSLNLLVNDYDDCMGKESWKRFNVELDKYVFFNIKKSKKIINIEMKRFSMLG